MEELNTTAEQREKMYKYRPPTNQTIMLCADVTTLLAACAEKDAQIKRMQDALARYGDHIEDCWRRHGPAGATKTLQIPIRCTCGWTKLAAVLKENP